MNQAVDYLLVRKELFSNIITSQQFKTTKKLLLALKDFVSAV